LTALAALSCRTEKVYLGTSVLIASLRNPGVITDITGTIQETSDERLIFGVGAGWDRHEFADLGVSFEERSTLTDECLEIIRGLWKVKPSASKANTSL